MSDMLVILEYWQMDGDKVREQIYRAPTPRERERWHALWLLTRGWSATQVAEALGRDAHAIGDWTEDFRQRGPAGLAFEQSGGSPPRSMRGNKRS
jgi:transposase